MPSTLTVGPGNVALPEIDQRQWCAVLSGGYENSTGSSLGSALAMYGGFIKLHPVDVATGLAEGNIRLATAAEIATINAGQTGTIPDASATPGAIPQAIKTTVFDIGTPALGSNSFTLPSTPTNPQSLVVTLNGVKLPASNVSLSGANVTLANSLMPSDDVRASYY